MSVYRAGLPYFVLGRRGESVDTVLEGGQRYEHVYSFSTRRELSLSEMRQIYAAVLQNPEIPVHARIRYFECSSHASGLGDWEGRVRVQFEATGQAIPHAVVVALIAAAVAAIAAAAVLVVAPTLAAAYRLTTVVLSMPSGILILLAALLGLGVLYVLLKTRPWRGQG